MDQPGVSVSLDEMYRLLLSIDHKVTTLTGIEVRAQLRQSYTSGSAMVTFGTADGSIVVGGTASTVRFMLSAASTSALGSALGYEQASLVFDAEAVEPGGVVSRIFQGVWTVSPEVTR